MPSLRPIDGLDQVVRGEHSLAAALGGLGLSAEQRRVLLLAADKPQTVFDLNATILHLLGLNHTKLIYPYNGRNMRLTDVSGEVIRDVLV